jgi:short-subunit dehydrogenase
MTSGKYRRFQGQVTFITGASSGIGEGLARRLAQEGALLALVARRSDRLERLKSQLISQGVEAVAIQADVTKEGQLERAVHETLKAFGRIDNVIANAGFSVSGELSSLTLADYQRQFETNVFGVLRTIYACLPELKKSRGRLVLVGSVAGHLTMPTMSAYSMSKFSVRALADSIRGELEKDGISVTLLSPGLVATELMQVDNLGQFDENLKKVEPSLFFASVDQACKEMLRAIHRRSRERVITGHGKALVLFHRLAPGLFQWLAGRYSS